MDAGVTRECNGVILNDDDNDDDDDDNYRIAATL